MNERRESQVLSEHPRFAQELPRRDFLGLAALWSFLATGFFMALGALRLPMPSVFPETGSRFRIGPPERFARGSTTAMSERNVLIRCDEGGISAMSTVCTHLGCIAKREPDGAGFICPCHGSRFDATGSVTQGPAPTGLHYFAVGRAPSGELWVDSDRRVDPQTRFVV